MLRPEPELEHEADQEAGLRPGAGPGPGLVIGVGARGGACVGELLGLIADTLRDAGLAPGSVVGLATLDTKAGDPAVTGAAARLGVPVRGYAAGLLATVVVPNPSGAPLAAVGTASVAEAAALAEGGVLLVPKRKSNPRGRPAAVTCAVAYRGRCRVEPAEAEMMSVWTVEDR
ncbi:cobalamin biosynthesis protein [Streptomyces sp. NPDC002018]|uniref:cobalamin biosynthesis protein n=1 Tax=Streptomyces sp. NPDC002018 TaxID=3364629 RepID=UPI0036A4B837